jgi:DNA-binding SARP family transcriptional activator
MTIRRSGGLTRAAAGSASLLALTALVAGLPAALYAVGGSPLPRTLPSWHQAITTLSQPDHGALLLSAIHWVSWLAWAAFTISALVEVFSLARGRAAPRLPVISPVQGLAAALVGTAIVGLVPGLHAPRPVPPLSRPVPAVASAPPRPGRPAWALPAAAAASLPVSSHPDRTASSPASHDELYRVVEGDNLWDIAARRLGTGERWHEIYALNRGKPQPVGGSLTDPSLIYPGWILLLPAHHGGGQAHGAANRDRSPGSPGQHRAVNGTPHAARNSHRPARAHHTERPRHPSLPPSPATPRPERPVGIHLPTGGLVGITLAAAVSTALLAWRLHRRRTAVPRWPARSERAEPPLPEAITRLRRAHLRSLAADEAEALGNPWPDEDSPGDSEADGGGDADDSGDGLDEFGAPAGPAPWRLPEPGAAAGLEPAASPPAASRPGSFAGTGASPLPAPVSATVPEQGQAGSGAPAGPGAAEANGRPGVPPGPPLPAGTVAFGIRHGAEIPLTEAAAGGLGLTGPGAPGAARALLIGLLSASSPGPSQARAHVVIPEADAQQLTEGHPQARIPGVAPGLPDGLITTPGLEQALDRIEAEITHRLRLADEIAGADLGGSSATGTTSPVLPPLALISSVDLESRSRVQAVLDAGERTGLVVIVLGDWAGGTTCRISGDGTVLAATDPGLAGVQVFHLNASEAATMLGLLRGAQGHLAPDPPDAPDESARGPIGGGADSPQPSGQPPGGGPSGERHTRPPAHQQTAVPPPPSRGRSAPRGPASSATVRAERPQAGRSPAGTLSPGIEATSIRPVQIAVLGPLRITAGGNEIRGGLRKARELLAYLALHPDGMTGAAISEALWPEASPRYATAQRHLALRKAREMLRTATGLPQPMFITLAGERYRLDPALIDVDVWHFNAALDQARITADPATQLEILRRAVTLYRESLAEGAGYEWAERYAEPARRRAVDALARIAELQQPAEPEQALNTLEAALAHDPYNEALYQKIMHIQAALGRPDAARRTLALLEARLSALGLTPGSDAP